MKPHIVLPVAAITFYFAVRWSNNWPGSPVWAWQFFNAGAPEYIQDGFRRHDEAVRNAT